MTRFLFKPIVPTGLCCVLCSYVFLNKTLSRTLAFGLCTIIFFLLLLTVLKTSGKKMAAIFSVLSVICFSSSILSFYVSEKTADEFLGSIQSKNECIYTAKITASRTYSSYSNADAEITSVNGKSTGKKLKCRFSFYSGENLTSGDTVVFSGIAKAPANDDSDSFNNVSFLRSRGIFITFDNVKILSSSADGKVSLRTKIYRYAEKVIYRYLPKAFNFEGADISYSMLLGDKAFLSPVLKRDFTRSGIIHLLCVSGMHLSIIMGAVYTLLYYISINKRIKLVIMIMMCLAYLSVIGFPVSALRAGIICIFGYCASLAGRKTDGYASLFGSLIIICIISPYSVLDISAQLSFFSAFGIITLSELFADEKTDTCSVLAKLWRPVKALLLSNIGAVLFTHFISASSFGAVSLTSVASTILTSFSCQLLLILLLILVILSPIPFIAPILSVLGFFCNYLSQSIISTARFFSNLRYCYTASGDVDIFAALFLFCILLLCCFIYFDNKAARLITVFVIVIMCVTSVFSSLITEIYRDSLYKVSYFRQNQNDRQLSIKLGTGGYLIINADNTLCINTSSADFDTTGNNNYILIIPDPLIHPSVLSYNIKSFDRLYGVRKVFVPDTEDGLTLSKQLLEYGCNTYILPQKLDFGKIRIDFDFSGGSIFFTVSDEKTKTSVLFSDCYSPEIFPSHSTVAAYFTRNTDNQFQTQRDTVPHCDTFYTRLGKGEEHHGVYNTYGKKSFYIKE